MASRVMQAKILKIVKAKRKAALIRPRSGGVDTSKITAHGIFQNRSRVNTTQGRAGEMLPVLENTWTQPIPETRDHYTYDPETGQHSISPRGLTTAQRHSLKEHEEAFIKDALLSFWQGSRRQGVDTWHRVLLKQGGDYKCFMVFSGNKFIFYAETNTHRWASCVYEGREGAMNAFANERICWAIDEPI